MGEKLPHQEPNGPYPARFWWLKRLSLGVVLLVTSLSAVRAGWGWESERRLSREFGAIAARGEPVSVQDLVEPEVPDGENVAAYLKNAAAAIDPDADCPASTALECEVYPPYPRQWHKLSDLSVSANGKAFELARRARAHRVVNWGTPTGRDPAAPGTPILAKVADHHLPVHHLANTVSDAALHAHVHGDDVAALELIRDVRHLARAVGSPPGVQGCAVSRNHETIALYKLQVIAAGLRVVPGEEPPPETRAAALPVLRPRPRPATAGHVRALVAELLDERAWDEDVRAGLAADRAMQIDAGLRLGRATWLLRPMVKLDLLRAMERQRDLPEAAAQRDWPAAVRVFNRSGRMTRPAPKMNYFAGLPPPGRPKKESMDFTRLLSDSDLMAGSDRLIEMDMRVRTMRRMAAVSLACQLYRADCGEWPPDLSALVPRYLPAVPVDPFSAEGAPLRYLLVKGALPGGGDRPVVYSVATNGRDDTPDVSVLPKEPHFGWYRWRELYLDLARWAPPKQPQTMPTTAPAPAPASDQCP